MTNRQFARCENCNHKPATIRRWVTDRDCARFCYLCDTQVPESPNLQRKEIIPYDEMITEGVSFKLLNSHNRQTSEQKDELQNQSLRQTPNNGTPVKSSIIKVRSSQEKQGPDTDIKSISNRHSQPQLSYNNPAKLSNDLRGYSSNKLENSNSYEFGRSESKASELKYRIRLQEQENTIQILKSHLESIEQSHQENLQKVKNDIQLNEEVNYKQVEKYSVDVSRIKIDNENRISQYMLQLEQERQRRENLEQKLDSLRKTHESKTLELQQYITQLRAENERQKMEKEKVIFDCDQQISKQRQQSHEENEKIIEQIKQEFSQTIQDYNQRLSNQMDQSHEEEYKIQQLQVSLQEVNIVWNQRNVQLVQEVDQLRNQLKSELEQKERVKKDNINLRQEMMILQKEQELYQKEKHQVDQKINVMNEKAQKFDRFIYGNKKSKKK